MQLQFRTSIYSIHYTIYVQEVLSIFVMRVYFKADMTFLTFCSCNSGFDYTVYLVPYVHEVLSIIVSLSPGISSARPKER